MCDYMLLIPGLILISVTIINKDLSSPEFQIILLGNFELKAAVRKLGNILVLLYDFCRYSVDCESNL